MTNLKIPAIDASRSQWLAYARFLALFTISYNLLEGIVSMGFGWADDSTALFGFGADSFIEVGSALLVLWRLRGDESGCESERLHRERSAAMGIGIFLVLLALGTAVGSVFQLVTRHHPDTTVPGLLVSVLSLGFMFWLWRSKQRAAKVLDSRSMEGDANCSLACIQLSTVLFAGSLAFLLVPALWWADAGAALLLSVFIAREGVSGIRAAMKPGFTGGCGCHG